jgi:hypothetical protein
MLEDLLNDPEFVYIVEMVRAYAWVLPAAVALAAGIAVGYLGFPWLWPRQPPTLEEREMSREQRETYVTSTVADSITNALEDALYKGKLTRQEVTNYYNIIGNRCGLKDLLVVANEKHQEEVKAAIQERRKNGANKPVKLPGSTPVVEKPKNRIQQLRLAATK